MGPIQIFLITAVLIGGSSLAIDEANGTDLPLEVEVIYTEDVTTTVQEAMPSEWLRPELNKFELQAVTNVQLDCYSDGSGNLRLTEGGQQLLDAVRPKYKRAYINALLKGANAMCKHEWEVRYGDTTGKSKPAWYF
tara:strand:+ start:258 stop:665 length:408 start_codon:yes stop_codon:yes gene_type:complete